jgi:hypothetical protein
MQMLKNIELHQFTDVRCGCISMINIGLLMYRPGLALKKTPGKEN